jgi:hypothetical protein
LHQLSQSKLDKLSAITVEHLRSVDWVMPVVGQQERTVTNHSVGPSIERLMEGLREPHLVIRYDGKLNPRSILRHGMNFLPDVEVYMFTQKCLAIEVKILRDSDASGSLTKAVGQTFLYKALGFEIAIGLIFDIRKNKRSGLQQTLDELSQFDDRVNFIVI